MSHSEGAFFPGLINSTAVWSMYERFSFNFFTLTTSTQEKVLTFCQSSTRPNSSILPRIKGMRCLHRTVECSLMTLKPCCGGYLAKVGSSDVKNMESCRIQFWCLRTKGLLIRSRTNLSPLCHTTASEAVCHIGARWCHPQYPRMLPSLFFTFHWFYSQESSFQSG